MSVKEIIVCKRKIKVVAPDNFDKTILNSEDREMDERVIATVHSAINKAEVVPIAKYDVRKRKAIWSILMEIITSLMEWRIDENIVWHKVPSPLFFRSIRMCRYYICRRFGTVVPTGVAQ